MLHALASLDPGLPWWHLWAYKHGQACVRACVASKSACVRVGVQVQVHSSTWQVYESVRGSRRVRAWKCIRVHARAYMRTSAWLQGCVQGCGWEHLSPSHLLEEGDESGPKEAPVGHNVVG